MKKFKIEEAKLAFKKAHGLEREALNSTLKNPLPEVAKRHWKEVAMDLHKHYLEVETARKTTKPGEMKTVLYQAHQKIADSYVNLLRGGVPKKEIIALADEKNKKKISEFLGKLS